MECLVGKCGSCQPRPDEGPRISGRGDEMIHQKLALRVSRRCDKSDENPVVAG